MTAARRAGAGLAGWRRPSWISPRVDGWTQRLGRGRLVAGLAMAVGAVLSVVAVIAIGRADAAGSVGGATAASLAVAPPVVAIPVATNPAAPPASGPPAAPTVVPVRIAVAEIDLVAAVRPVGIDPVSGNLEVPDRIDVVGWYRFGPGLEANTGSIVVAGHVDLAGQGPAAFFRIGRLGPGALVEVTGADGAVRWFRVVAREEWPKSEVPMDRVFGRGGAARLTLMSCSGPFDRTARSYRRNIVITAVPA